MKVLDTQIKDVKILQPKVFSDHRGFFFEQWKHSSALGAGIDLSCVQANVSRSAYGVLRGLHYQYPQGQAKLVSALDGEIFDVAVDIRPDSPSFGVWVGCVLSGDNHRQMYIPSGCAHGFCVLSESVLISYLCDAEYSPGNEGCIRWDDPELAIDWPIEPVDLSQRDANSPCLSDIDKLRLPGI